MWVEEELQVTCILFFERSCLKLMLAVRKTNVTHHIKTGQLLVECISRYYSICMGKNKEYKKKFPRLIFDHRIAMLHPIYT